MSRVDLDKEVKAYNAKKNKLNNSFVAKISKYIDSKRHSIKATRSAIQELNKKEAQDLKDVEKARNILTNV